MNVEIGAEVALFPEKEYISGIFLAVQWSRYKKTAQLAQLDQGLACCIVHVFYCSDIKQLDLT